MILRNRLFERREPNRDAKTIYIFAEGAKREKQYFEFFKGINSRIKIEVYPLASDQDNSPKGLLALAEHSILPAKENSNPQYEFIEGDEVWLVMDIDPDKFSSRKAQFESVQTTVDSLQGWQMVRSNPCFEVWLYGHVQKQLPKNLESLQHCLAWKRLLPQVIKGGFNSRKFPILIKSAIAFAQQHYRTDASGPLTGSTELFKLGKSIYGLVKPEIEKALQNLNYDVSGKS